MNQRAALRPPALTPGTWHQLDIVVRDNTYQVYLDEMLTTTYLNTDPFRGLPAIPAGAEGPYGYVGLQSFLGRVQFRSVRIRTP